MNVHLDAWDAWMELGQSGRLLDRGALLDPDAPLGPGGLKPLPEPEPARFGLADHLRDALTQEAPERAARGEELSTLLDVVLGEACGLREGWRKGSAVGAAEAQKLLDGTVLKPRRVLSLGGEPVLAVFITAEERVGLHKGRRDMAHVVEYLRRRRLALGLLTNGRQWRLVFADTDNLAWVEWAADRWLDADALHRTLHLLRRLLSPASLTPGKDGAPSPLLAAIRAARRGQARLSKELGERVRQAVELLLQARRPVLEPVWEAHATGTYGAACHFVMRLVVVLFAEARELLPVDNPVYHRAYGLRGLLESLGHASAERRRGRISAWPRLLALFKLLHAGSSHPQLIVPTYGGDLFRAGDAAGDGAQRALAVLESVASPPVDETIYQMLVRLTRTTERVREGSSLRSVPVPVDFTELTSEYIGILYEGLLDYELRRAESEPIVFLNLGDQPALPLDRLEGMSDKQLGALVEKAKVKRVAAEEKDAEDADEEADAGEDEDEAEVAGDNDEEKTEEGEGAAFEPLLEETAKGGYEEAKARARAWAERAVVAGKLVRAPRGKKGKEDPAWKADVEQTAKGLIVALKLPGELYLVRWGGTRKGAGTFYTRPQLTLPTVRRTLEPLIRDEEGTPRPPETLLALKVCDPAMGSGSFLVATLRILTAVVMESLIVHDRLRRDGKRVRIACDLLPEADRDQPEERVEAIVRRAVVEYCLYGVDIDPLAVELARVALWVETLDPQLPFTFLDHKLRCGDALVGTWLDRFRDYPLLAWWRQSPDEKWRGVNHEGDVWAKALKGRRAHMVEEQRLLLDGVQPLPFNPVDNAMLNAAMKRLQELTEQMHAVPASQPDERARIWREEILPDAALKQVRAAFDIWCALWFWPLDRLDEAPGPYMLVSPQETAREIVQALREKKRFFHWELEFADVFTKAGAGFDAVVGNPPWEVRKPSSKEFFSDVDPLYRSYGKQEALTRQRELFSEDPRIEERWLDHLAGLKDAANFVRYAGEPFGNTEDAKARPTVALVPRKAEASRELHAGWAAKRAETTETLGRSDPEHPFRHQGSADLNSYKLFTEQALAVVRPGGQVGLVTPSGLYTDKGSVDLRRRLLDRCDWRWLYGFENRDKIFDIHRSFKFAIIIAQKGSRTEVLQAAFMRHALEDWVEAKAAFVYPAADLELTGLGIAAFFEIIGEPDLATLRRVFASKRNVHELGPQGVFTTELHKTNDSRKIKPAEYLLAAGIDVSGRSMLSAGNRAWLLEQRWVPVWEGKCCRFDQWIAEPTLFAAVEDVRAYLRGDFVFGFRRIARNTDERTMVGCIVPPLVPTTYTIEVSRELPSEDSYALYGLLTSCTIDWVMRFQVSSSVALFNLHALPLPNGDWRTVKRALAPRVRKLLQETSAERRCGIRAELDATVAALYGLSSDDLRWILRDCDHSLEDLADSALCRSLDPKGFWRIDKDLDPELRHTVLTLVAFDDLEKLIVEASGDPAKGMAAFQALNDGEGWEVPTMLRLTDLGLGRDARAGVPQPVAGQLGRRLAGREFAGLPEDSLAHLRQHAEAIFGQEEYAMRFEASNPAAPSSAPPAGPPVLLSTIPADIKTGVDEARLMPLFANVVRETPVPPEPKTPEPPTAPIATESLPMTLSRIRLLNFRNWNDQHWASGIELRPMTLVLGRNSAGKTSILQPLRMLKQTIDTTDATTHLHMGAGLPDGLNLGAYEDVVNGHDASREVGVGFDLVENQISVDVQFRLVAGRPAIESLTYKIREERMAVMRTHGAYQLWSPRFRLPDWDGAKDVHLPKKAYEPGRAIEFSENALADLGPTLGPQVRAAMLAVKDAFKTFHYLGPMRPPPTREVTWMQQDPSRLGSTGSETVQALIGSSTRREASSLLASVSEWLKRLDLADGIEVNRLGSSLLYQIEILRGENRSNIVDVGYGVSQVLPVIVLLHFVPEGSVVLCEDPEAHLHPMAQSGLADMFVELAQKRRLQVLLETHSEHLFRRLQYLMAEGRIRSADCSLYYVERDAPSAHLTTLESDEFGRVQNWPDELFGDAIGEVERQTMKVFERMKQEKSRG